MVGTAGALEAHCSCLQCRLLLTACKPSRRGSAVAKIIAENAAKYADFEDQVRMWVFEEIVDGRKLTEIINTEHVNKKYVLIRPPFP